MILDSLRREFTRSSSAIPEEIPHQRLWRRQRLLVPTGVNSRLWRRQRILRAMYTLRHMKVSVGAMKMETKRMKKAHRKAKADLKELQAMFTQLQAERRLALNESAWTQVCSNTMDDLLFTEAIGDVALADQLRASLHELMMAYRGIQSG